MSIANFYKFPLCPFFLWASAFLALGETFNYEFTTTMTSPDNDISDSSWMCLANLEDYKVCDCFSDCPGSVDEEFCASPDQQHFSSGGQVKDQRGVQVPLFSGEALRYTTKCCALLGETNSQKNISPQAIKYCRNQNNAADSHKSMRRSSDAVRRAKSVISNAGPTYDNINYAVNAIGQRLAKRDGFNCDENKRQIPFNYVCDGEPDCLDGSDENDTLCSMMG